MGGHSLHGFHHHPYIFHLHNSSESTGSHRRTTTDSCHDGRTLACALHAALSAYALPASDASGSIAFMVVSRHLRAEQGATKPRPGICGNRPEHLRLPTGIAAPHHPSWLDVRAAPHGLFFLLSIHRRHPTLLSLLAARGFPSCVVRSAYVLLRILRHLRPHPCHGSYLLLRVCGNREHTRRTLS